MVATRGQGLWHRGYGVRTGLGGGLQRSMSAIGRLYMSVFKVPTVTFLETIIIA